MIDAAIQEHLEHLATVYPDGLVPVESLAACQAELDEAKERIDTLTGFVYSAEADRDRLTAALEQIDSIVRQRRGVSERIKRITRAALGSAQTTQEPA